jgi:hypothetical protein
MNNRVCAQCKRLKPCYLWRSTMVTATGRRMPKQTPVCTDCAAQLPRWLAREAKVGTAR